MSVAPEDEEKVIITWPLEADFSAFAGELKVEFVGKSDGDEIIKLQSNGLQFKPSVEGTALPPKNVFEQAMSEMERLAQEAVNAAGQSKLNADKSESVLESVTETVQGVSESLERAEELVTQINGDAEAAAESAAAAKLSADNAAESEKNSAASASAAKASENSASSSKTAAAGSASAAKTSETNAAASQSAARIVLRRQRPLRPTLPPANLPQGKVPKPHRRRKALQNLRQSALKLLLVRLICRPICRRPETERMSRSALRRRMMLTSRRSHPDPNYRLL